MKNGEESDEPNIVDLVSQLRQEKIFITSEKEHIRELNELIQSRTEDVIQKVWIITKQRLLLHTHRDITPELYQQLRFLAASGFVDAKNTLGFQNATKIGTLLQTLRTQPAQFAQWLIFGEQVTDEICQHSSILESILTGLYASLTFSEDIQFVLTLLYELAKLQLVKADNPRRILKQGTCTFRKLFLIFHEVLPSARFFLNAVLEVPILKVLASSDYYLDTTVDKTAMRFKQDDEISLAYKDIREFRNDVCYKLAELTNHFIKALQENIHSFPKPLSWLVINITKIISKSFSFSEACTIATELIFTLYICPAIVDPQRYGICDAQISDISRHNLMQVGQIIQMLAVNKTKSSGLQTLDFYGLLDKDTITNILDELLENSHIEELDFSVSPPTYREMMLFTEEELNILITFLQKIHTDFMINNNSNKQENLTRTTIEAHIASLSFHTSESSPRLNKPLVNGINENNVKKVNILSLVSKNNISRSCDDVNSSANSVLMFRIDKSNINEPLGLLPEEKVRSLTSCNNKSMSDMANRITPALNRDGENKTTFNNFQDEGSIGNTSDNLEAISEAASNHSVASSLELENEDQNDNLSDMVSANVSGRGSPNISGRDTPSSQINENEDRAPEARQADAPQPQPQISRQINSEIDDKFCKFEIKKLLEGDETISIISETWSTDVLASDNEAIDSADTRAERQSVSLIDQAISENPILNPLDISETQSESAWSTDVMMSDTDRLTEVDNDDISSVAQSDVAPSEDARSETDEVSSVGARRFSNTSFSGHTTSIPNYNSQNMPSYQENKKSDTRNDKTLSKPQTDNNANNIMLKSFVLVDSPAIQNSSSMEISVMQSNTMSYTEISTMKSTVTHCNNKPSSLHNGKLPSPTEVDLRDAPGPSGMNKKGSSNGETDHLTYQKQNNSKYEERSNEILLSNCSLNSSSSGSSSNSYENKQVVTEQWENKQWMNNGSGNSLNVTSTPSESTSELSVLSVNVINSGNILSKKTSTLITSRTLKPSASTGAIPKSISFDMSADKGDKFADDDQRSKRGSFFGKFRMMGFRNRRGKSLRSSDDYYIENQDCAFTDGKASSEMSLKRNTTEVMDDILAKYRTKNESSPIKIHHESSRNGRMRSDSIISPDSNNSLGDIKKKIKLVLSSISSQIPGYVDNSNLSLKSKLESLLRIELGRLRTHSEWSQLAQISEALRCISCLDDGSCLKLVQSLKEELLDRASYLQYLINSKKKLLYCDSFLHSLLGQIRHDQLLCDKYLSAVCVNQFLIEQENLVSSFAEEFKQLHLADEKCDCLCNFYAKLYSIMERSTSWQDLYRSKRKSVKLAVERFIISKVYKNALYPNGDGDRDRDSVLHQHIAKLATVITPNHKDLMINKIYLGECPWSAAQDTLRAMGAYKTPRDKLHCVVQCAKSIMNLLSFAQNSSTAADDFTPVLVFVIIKANPRDLLSTVQFVNSFYHSQLNGEEQYWWTQFCAAVEFIKTMDYTD